MSVCCLRSLRLSQVPGFPLPLPHHCLGIVLSFSLCRGCLSTCVISVLSPRSALRKQGVPALPTAQDQKPSAFSYHLLSRILEVSERERETRYTIPVMLSVSCQASGDMVFNPVPPHLIFLVLSCFVFETGSQCVFQTVLRFMNSDGSLTSVFIQP